MSMAIRSILIVLLVGLAGLAGPASRAQGAPIGIGLSALNDWSTAQPLLDVMKLARPWIGHKPGRWGGMSYEELRDGGYLDPQGWPLRMPPELSSIGTVVLTDIPEEAVGLAGRYRLSFEGSGIVEVAGSARNVRYGKGQVEFDFAPNPGLVDIRIQRTDPFGVGDHVRNISIVRVDRLPLVEAGAVFNPDFLDRIEGFKVLRFMDWMDTNNSTLSRWKDRPRLGDFSYTLKGMPLELMIRLANETGSDPWFTIPHLADDDFVRRFATMVRDGLDPGRRVYAEFSNEVWNWSFAQAHWAEEQAQARWGQEHKWVQYYALRAAEVAGIWADVFGPAAGDRLVRVLSTQTGWLGLEHDILYAPLWTAEAPDRAPPAEHFDAYAVTGYFGVHLGTDEHVGLVRGWIEESRAAAAAAADAAGLAGADRAAYLLGHRFDLAVERAGRHLAGAAQGPDAIDDVGTVLGHLLTHHAQVAEEAGLPMIAYEGGTHVVGIGNNVNDEELTAFFTHFNYSREMGQLYRQLLEGWERLGGGLFVAFQGVATPSKWGSWGTLRHLDDSNPRWDALIEARDGVAQ